MNHYGSWLIDNPPKLSIYRLSSDSIYCRPGLCFQGGHYLHIQARVRFVPTLQKFRRRWNCLPLPKRFRPRLFSGVASSRRIPEIHSLCFPNSCLGLASDLSPVERLYSSRVSRKQQVQHYQSAAQTYRDLVKSSHSFHDGVLRQALQGLSNVQVSSTY